MYYQEHCRCSNFMYKYMSMLKVITYMQRLTVVHTGRCSQLLHTCRGSNLFILTDTRSCYTVVTCMLRLKFVNTCRCSKMLHSCNMHVELKAVIYMQTSKIVTFIHDVDLLSCYIHLHAQSSNIDVDFISLSRLQVHLQVNRYYPTKNFSFTLIISCFHSLLDKQ